MKRIASSTGWVLDAARDALGDPAAVRAPGAALALSCFLIIAAGGCKDERASSAGVLEPLDPLVVYDGSTLKVVTGPEARSDRVLSFPGCVDPACGDVVVVQRDGNDEVRGPKLTVLGERRLQVSNALTGKRRGTPGHWIHDLRWTEGAGILADASPVEPVGDAIARVAEDDRMSRAGSGLHVSNALTGKLRGAPRDQRPIVEISGVARLFIDTGSELSGMDAGTAMALENGRKTGPREEAADPSPAK